MYIIYLILAITQGVGQWKVGITTDLDSRLRNLKVGNPNIACVESTYEIQDRVIAYKTETLIKNHLKYSKVGGEWFEFESLDGERFQALCEKYEYSARVWKQIQTDITNHKNNIYTDYK